MRPRESRSHLCGLLGQGVAPSLTPEMHEREALRHRMRLVYKTVELDERRTSPGRLRELLDHAVELGFDGLNVTHPVKQAMVPLVDRVSPEVAAIGALNTVVIRDGQTFGHNTDVTGFGVAFRAGLPEASLESVVLLGAGGAGTAVGHALAGLGARHLAVHDPDAGRAERLVASVRDLDAELVVEQVGGPGLADAVASASGVVNATPVGMAAHPGSPITPDLLTPSLWVADIVYRPLLTELLAAAAARGCRTLNGSGMAVHQAADAFELFTGRPAHRDAMLRDFDQMVAAEVALETSRERKQ
ncbi:shikimate dehydrogenase [Nocardioides sp.]|uniref:shikimate dehydrogenase n=1 Tax=Nocardioides sp. TaxID=35761 RepID=UPI002D8085ED|nr:shikimate dehydrogenase [Nocardioides sp.]HET8962039.1 shikimate dehydrogenase [Nocardioides sp.]